MDEWEFCCSFSILKGLLTKYLKTTIKPPLCILLFLYTVIRFQPDLEEWGGERMKWCLQDVLQHCLNPSIALSLERHGTRFSHQMCYCSLILPACSILRRRQRTEECKRPVQHFFCNDYISIPCLFSHVAEDQCHMHRFTNQNTAGMSKISPSSLVQVPLI